MLQDTVGVVGDQKSLPGAIRHGGQSGMIGRILERAESAGYPAAALEDLRSRADMLQRVARIAEIDVDAEAKLVWERTAEIRRQRAELEKKAAEKSKDPVDRLSGLQRAQQLELQAKKLENPGVDEGFKARAVATELSIRLNARMRGIRFSVSDVEPSSLRIFEKSFQDHAKGVQSLGSSRAEAEHTARMAFLQAMVEVDAMPDDPTGLRSAIVQYRRNTTRDFGPESGHMKDQPLEATPEIQDMAAPVLDGDEDVRKGSREVSRLRSALDLAAAVELSDRHYAVYRVLAANTHLFDWKMKQNDYGIDQLVFVKRQGADRGENIAQKVMEDVGGYSGRGAAYRAVHETIDRVSEALEKLGRNVSIDGLTQDQRAQAAVRLTASREQINAAAKSVVRSGGNRKVRQREEIE